MSLVWGDGQVSVESVAKSGPAAKAGMRPAEVLLEIDGKPTAEFEQFTLRELLTFGAGKTRSVPNTQHEEWRDAPWPDKIN